MTQRDIFLAFKPKIWNYAEKAVAQQLYFWLKSQKNITPKAIGAGPKIGSKKYLSPCLFSSLIIINRIKLIEYYSIQKKILTIFINN